MREAPRDPAAPFAPAGFGQATAAFVVVASMVGVGVLGTSGYTVYRVGSNQLMLALWVLGGLTAACGALTLCELTAALPRTGGDYVYLHEAYGPAVAFLAGWVTFLIGFAAPSASAALASSKYLLAPLGLGGADSRLAQRGLATVLLLAFALVHGTGRRRGAWVQGAVTSAKLALLGAFVVAGLAAGRGNLAYLADRPPITPDRLVTMLWSLVFVSYAYVGWNSASFLAGEFSDPQKQLPRAVLAATGGVVVLYLAVNLVYALALSAEDVRRLVEPTGRAADVENVAPVAELAARRLFGPGWSRPFSVAVGLMLLSPLSAYVLTGPRVVYAMALAGHFPAPAARLTARGRTPAVAIALTTAAALGLLWVGTLAGLVEYAGVGLAVFSMLAVGAVYVLRHTRPDLPRPFRTPGYPWTPAFYLLVNAALVAATVARQPLVTACALGSILAGVPVYYLGGTGAGAAGRGSLDARRPDPGNCSEAVPDEADPEPTTRP